jgi:hypothetical protein
MTLVRSGADMVCWRLIARLAAIPSSPSRDWEEVSIGAPNARSGRCARWAAAPGHRRRSMCRGGAIAWVTAAVLGRCGWPSCGRMAVLRIAAWPRRRPPSPGLPARCGARVVGVGRHGFPGGRHRPTADGSAPDESDADQPCSGAPESAFRRGLAARRARCGCGRSRRRPGHVKARIARAGPPDRSAVGDCRRREPPRRHDRGCGPAWLDPALRHRA